MAARVWPPLRTLRVCARQARSAEASIPQLFIKAVRIGALDDVIRLNDTGNLEKLTADCEKRTSDAKCASCGGVGYILCRWCQGTNKSRSHAFNADPTKNFLKCTVCNQNGLERCDKC